MNDALGDRMKAYEGVTKAFLPRRTYTLIRVDGRSFHTYTKGLQRPYDSAFMTDMDDTAIHLCKEVAGAVCAYVQSDEISVLAYDFKSIHTEPWFGGNVQKIASLSAAAATWYFTRRRMQRDLISEGSKVTLFDSRVFTIPDPVEVCNYFVWRQKDATRNSISSAAQSMFPHKELNGLNTDQLQEKMWAEKEVNWNDYPIGFKRGRLIQRVPFSKETPLGLFDAYKWATTMPDVFTQTDQLRDLIPTYETVQAH